MHSWLIAPPGPGSIWSNVVGSHTCRLQHKAWQHLAVSASKAFSDPQPTAWQQLAVRCPSPRLVPTVKGF